MTIFFDINCDNKLKNKSFIYQLKFCILLREFSKIVLLNKGTS